MKSRRSKILTQQSGSCYLCGTKTKFHSCSLIKYNGQYVVTCKNCNSKGDPFSGKKIGNRGDIIKNLYTLDKRCYYCNRDMSLYSGIDKDASLDHKTPKSKNGTNHLENIVLCCKKCNSLKGSMTELEFFWFLKDQGNIYHDIE